MDETVDYFGAFQFGGTAGEVDDPFERDTDSDEEDCGGEGFVEAGSGGDFRAEEGGVGGAKGSRSIVVVVVVVARTVLNVESIL